MTKDMGLGILALIFSVLYLIEASRIRTSALGDSVGAGGVPTHPASTSACACRYFCGVPMSSQYDVLL